MHHFESPHSHHIDSKKHPSQSEKRPGDTDFSSFDWAQFQADEDKERARRKQLKQIVEDQREYEREQEAKRKKEEEIKRQEDEKKRVEQEKADKLREEQERRDAEEHAAENL